MRGWCYKEIQNELFLIVYYNTKQKIEMNETKNLGVWYGILWIRVVRSVFEDILGKFDLLGRDTLWKDGIEI